jgi:hypothetical protein
MFHPNKGNMIPLAPCTAVETIYDPVKDIEEYISLKIAALETDKLSAICGLR